jgi:hypothetical protein
MAKIFISYRQADSIGITGRIYDRLEPHFGRENLFMDIDTIPLGIDFRNYIDEVVSQCDVLLAVIGEQWLIVSKGGQRRLDDQADWVRIEIETALKRGIPVIPVIIGQTPKPTPNELPAGLADLAYRQAIQVDPGRDFHHHIDRLIRDLECLLREAKDETSNATVSSSKSPGTKKIIYLRSEPAKLLPREDLTILMTGPMRDCPAAWREISRVNMSLKL